MSRASARASCRRWLFLFTVFLMFAVVANLPGFTFGSDGLARIGERDGVTEVRAKVAEERLRADAAVGKAKADLHRARAETTYDADRVPRAERALVKAREDRDGLTSVQRLFPAPDALSATADSGTGGWLDAMEARHGQPEAAALQDEDVGLEV